MSDDKISEYHPELWNYEPWTPDTMRPYGDETTYRIGLSWLYETCDLVEDWGAGMAYGRRFVPEGKRYFAVDGAPSSARFVDLVCTLDRYEPPEPPDGIFMRHVLEHNPQWKPLLRKALAAFTKRFCLVLFTPITYESTHPMRIDGDAYYDLSFNFAELAAVFSEAQLRIESELLKTNTQYGRETILRCERK